ncbi:MAG: hypothetical protein ACK46X_18685 [Candidatus Sericytochromatia bacterium]
MSVRLQQRRGGALYPVLLISACLLIMSSLLPQVLISSSHAQKNDLARDRLLECAESGIAFAEARLKTQVVADVLADAARKPAADDKWVMKPSYDSPDYGPKKDATYEVKLVMRGPAVVKADDAKEVTMVPYRLHAQATSARGRSMEIGVSGLITVECLIDTAGSGLPSRILRKVMVNGVNQEL